MKHQALLMTCLLCLSLSAHSQTIESYVTTADRSSLLQKQETSISFTDSKNERSHYIIVDPNQTYQTMDGFGFALTGGSAEHLIGMSRKERTKILRELFDPEEGIGISCIRLTLGASDLNSFVFSYDDMPEGQEDFELRHFSLAQDLNDIVPVMKEILKINPDIHIMSSPWSAPAWMKTSRNSHGGKLRKECYSSYADYFVRYVTEMKKHGINIEAITVQNESLNSGNTPSMPWLPDEQLDFVKNHLGPKFIEAKLDTKIIIFDHNTDRPEYPLTLYADAEAAKYIDGSAFHNYRGDISAMSYVHESRPDKNLYFTEQMVTNNPKATDLAIAEAVNRLIVNISRNWSKNIILWNLAANSENDPHTDNGGCSMCQGAITIDGDYITSRNIAYYVIGHASKFVPSGSKRISSTAPYDRYITLCEDEQSPRVFRYNVVEHSNVAPNVAFRTPDGKIVLIISNDSWSRKYINIQYNGRYASQYIEPGSVVTCVWDE